ncbi:unnamed protein product, partial [Rotaria sp. Silwood1]
MKPVRRSQSGSDEYDEENLDRHRHLIVQGYGSLPNRNLVSLLPAAMKGYNELLDRIKAVLDKRNRPYLNVFNLGCDEDLTEAVFRAALRSSQDKNKTDSNNKGQSDADPSDKQEILRDLLLWSVYTGRSDTAVVILLYIQERIGAALLAAALAIRISSSAKEINKRKVFSDHAKEYEKYATNCINACHKRNEERTSHILLSKKKIYGDATYMQIAIASNIQDFIITDCVSQALNEKWFAYPPPFMIKLWWDKFIFAINIVLFGVAAPFFYSIDVSNISNQQQKLVGYLAI